MQVIAHDKHNGNIAETERWASVIAGSAFAVIGLAKRSGAGLSAALMGAELVRRGITGHSFLYEYLGMRTAGKGQGGETTSVPYELGVRVDRAITVAKPRAEVYRYWRNLENLPRFMKHVESVQQFDDRRSRWIVSAPAGRTVEWEAEIINEIENGLIGFRSLGGGNVDLAGSVQFKDAPAGRGTEVIVEIQYNPPAGILGAFAAKMWGEEPTQQIGEDLQRFKQMVEAGEIPTTAGQPSGPSGRELKSRHRRHHQGDHDVTRASEESFPASDAPAWRL
jgi:uncharacterized membrane protein